MFWSSLFSKMVPNFASWFCKEIWKQFKIQFWISGQFILRFWRRTWNSIIKGVLLDKPSSLQWQQQFWIELLFFFFFIRSSTRIFLIFCFGFLSLPSSLFCSPFDQNFFVWLIFFSYCYKSCKGRNYILFPKLFWPTVIKNWSSDWKSFCQFEAGRQRICKIFGITKVHSF